MPAFEGLLPLSCDELVQNLLFTFAQWHGLAKLRLHTSVTLKLMKKLTSQLGSELRAFAKLTEGMDVRETPKEYSRRKRQAESAKANKRPPSTQTLKHGGTTDGRRSCVLNLNTYKMHALGDYVRTIEEYGTTDSYSTQIVCFSLS
jgi:hypothetical protein